MDRDQAIKLNESLTTIKNAMSAIKTAVETIAVNTTPADDSEPAADSGGES